jgi:hypothetical protein
MELDPKDYDVAKLLAKLKKEEDQYPSDLFASRRQGYIRRVAEIGVGLGVSGALKTTLKASKAGASATTTTIGGLVEAALVVAIVAEASAAAYIYRDQIGDVIESYSSQTQVYEVPPTSENFVPSPAEIALSEPPEITETPEETSTVTTEFASVTDGLDNLTQDVQINSTPDPNGNNGLHLGQTPKPARTKPAGKDKGGNDKGGNNRGGNNK